ncbi:MAG: helix-turn-helix transcriptional regulator, partial [Actinomycetota bacterium]
SDDPTATALAALLGAERGREVPAAAGPGLASGLLAFASAVRSRRPSGLAEADARLAPFPWWHQLARRVAAESAIENGWGDPAGWLRESLAFFDTAGHERMASACRALLRRAGAPVPRKGRGDADVPAPLSARGVTSREMDVLRMIGEGLGNREIAARLFLSARTIETHVASLLRKLEVGSRAGLKETAAEFATGHA